MTESVIKVGVLHSESGAMARTEAPLVAAALMAIDEINAGGGILGARVEAVIGHGASQPEVFAREAERLLSEEGVVAIFGCWTSSARKAVKCVVEDHGAQLWYPVQYEGLEQSPNIFYTGSCPNQQVYPAIRWSLSHGYRRFFLLGSDYVFPRTANSMIRSLVKSEGSTVVGEEYAALEECDFSGTVSAIVAAKPDMVISTLNGESAGAFFRELRAQGVAAETTPVLSTSFSEIDLASVPEADGHLACWSYFSSVDSPENRVFAEHWQTRNGAEVPLADPVVTAYGQVHLWAAAVKLAGSPEPGAVREVAEQVAFEGPAGRLQLLANHHVRRSAMVGRARTDGAFEIVWQSESAIDPQPWLGADDLETPFRGLILDALRHLPDALHSNWALTQEVDRRTKAEQQLELDAEQLRSQLEEIEELNTQLAQRAAEASAANKELEAFAYAVSHDLRAPLRAMSGFCAALEEDYGAQLDDTARQYMTFIRSSAHTMGELIDGLLVLSRATRGDLVREEVDVSALADRALARMKEQEPERDVTWEIDPELTVTADSRMLSAVLENLLSNAWKYSGNNDHALVRVYEEAAFGRRWICVSDNGAGFDPAYASQLFEPFRRLHRQEEFPGIGIGLATVQRIVNRHGGEIRADSAVGQGATFCFWLPER